MKKRIKLTEQDIHNMVKESLKNVLNENFDPNYEKLIRDEIHNLCDLESKVPYSYRREIRYIVNNLQAMLSGIRMH